MVGNILYRLAARSMRRPLGLWEVKWEVEALDGYSSEYWIQEEATKLMSQLLWNEWAMLYLNKWGTDEWMEFPMGKALHIIQVECLWVAPNPGEWCLVMRCTEKGEKHFGELYSPDSLPVRP
jgi:hypothetical protein